MINRLIPTIVIDIKQQYRYGFYIVAAFTVIVFVLMLSQFDQHASLAFIPVFIFMNMMLGTFYFVAGMVLFEKGEGILQGLVVTPLRVEEYLGSKVLTLTALALVENIVMVTAIFGTGYNLLLLIAGTIISAIMYILIGFVVVSRYRSISEYLMPSALILVAILLPIVDYLKIFETPLMYLHPMQAPLLLMKAAFVPVETWQFAYGVLYSAVVIAAVFVLSKRAFDKHIVNKEGDN
ncbi:ABC transporter permease [Methanocella sp. MCL-LM]|uniref:ABC transporter permease n=1 Tax=Methanocella sp. MCL-LM TaxID=3412035 RepID=UPI003C73F0B7